jgi:hypothetical protein
MTVSQSLPYEIRFYKSALGLGVNKGFQNLLSEVAAVLKVFSFQNELSSADFEVIRNCFKLILIWLGRSKGISHEND